MPKITLNIVSNVAVITVAAVLIGVTIYDRVSPAKPAMPTISKLPKGSTFPFPDRSAAGSGATAVLFVSKSCHFCSESMPFYKRLSVLNRAAGFRLIAAVPQPRETREDGAAYFSQHGVTPDAIVPMNFGSLGVVSTPTVVLVGADGRVAATWHGQLTSEREDGVLSKIKEVCPSCVAQ